MRALWRNAVAAKRYMELKLCSVIVYLTSPPFLRKQECLELHNLISIHILYRWVDTVRIRLHHAGLESTAFALKEL